MQQLDPLVRERAGLDQLVVLRAPERAHLVGLDRVGEDHGVKLTPAPARAEIRRQDLLAETDRYLAALVDEVGEPIDDELAAAEAVVDRVASAPSAGPADVGIEAVWRVGRAPTAGGRVGGDHMGGLALAIGIAILAMIAVPAAIGGALGRVVLRGRAAAVGVALGAAAGAGLGLLAVTWTFFESTWSPPAELTVRAPADFSHEWVYIVADPTADRELRWTGSSLPFARRVAAIDVPRSGVVRVRDLGELDGAWTEARLEVGGVDSAVSSGMAGLTLPPPRGRVVAFGFAPYPGTEPAPSGDAVALAERIDALEAGH